MKTIKYITNVKDSGSLEKLKAQLDNQGEIIEWNLDLNDPGKILTIKTEKLTSEQISRIISGAGFKNQEIIPGWKKAAKRLFTKDCCN